MGQKQEVQEQKVLFRVNNLKQYFPTKGSNQFKAGIEYVKANDGITLDLYEGETLGLVGESGCGKSTFGRTLLQLQPQTEGEILYYGSTIYEMLPEYRRKLYRRLPKVVKQLERLQKKGKSERYNKLKLQLAEEVGGFLCSTDLKSTTKLLERHYVNLQEQKRIRQKLRKSQEIGSKKSKQEYYEKKLVKLQDINQNLETQVEQLRERLARNQEYEELESKYEAGINLSKLNSKEMRMLRKELQLVFQDPYSSLNPKMTVAQLIGEGVKTHEILQGKKEMKPYISNLMERCGLASYLMYRYPHQFSGGQRQRIGIARSLALKPKFLVCDEAVSALDVSIQSQIINLLLELKEQEHLTYLFISHDLSVVKYVSDRVGVMYLGKLVELAECEKLYSNPLHPYTKALLSAIPTMDEKKADIIELCGEPPNPRKPPTGCRFHTRCPFCKKLCMEQEPELTQQEQNHYVACHYVEELKKNYVVSGDEA